jgi:hypothetical protein
MSNYTITDYSFKQAKKLGVTIKPSANKMKKIDVFKQGAKIASIGDINYTDYATTKDSKQRSSYKARHSKYSNIKGTPSFYASNILW